jgi:hypothetical protein
LYGGVKREQLLKIKLHGYTYNLKKKHKEPEKFNDQDTQLLDAISTLNTRSKEINERLQTCSPNCSRDLYYNTKHRSRTRISYNLNLYEDGLYLKPLLAKVWLRKLAQHIKSRDGNDYSVNRRKDRNRLAIRLFVKF